MLLLQAGFLKATPDTEGIGTEKASFQIKLVDSFSRLWPTATSHLEINFTKGRLITWKLPVCRSLSSSEFPPP